MNEKYNKLVESILDRAAKTEDLGELRSLVETLKILGEGITYNAVLRTQEETHSPK